MRTPPAGRSGRTAGGRGLWFLGGFFGFLVFGFCVWGGAFLVFWGDKYFGGYIVGADSISARFAVARSLRADMESAPMGWGAMANRVPCATAHPA